MKYLTIILTFFILSCVNSKSIKKEYKLTREEQEFKNNKLSKSQNKHLDLFFSYLNNDYGYFIEKSKEYLKNNNNLSISFYIVLKLINLHERYYINYYDLISILNTSKNPFIKLYIKLLEEYHKFKYLDKKNISNLFSYSKLKYKGYYKYLSTYDFYNTKKLEKKSNKDLDFKKGKILIPDVIKKNTSEERIHKLTSYFYVDSSRDVTFFISSNNSVFRILLDDKEFFVNGLFANKIRNILIKKINIKKGKHKIDIFLLGDSSFYLYTDKILKQSDGKNYQKSKFKLIKDYNKEIFKELFSYKLSDEIKNIFAYDISKNIENIHNSYNHLKELKYDNFYRDFLFFDYFSNFINSNKYLNNVLKKNKDFLEAKYIYLNSIKDENKQLKYIKNINKKSLEYYFNLINIYYKLGLISKVIDILNKVDFKEVLYEIKDIVSKYDIKLFENISDKLLSNLKGNDLSYIENLILSHPFDKNYKKLLNILKEKNKKRYLVIKKNISNNFYDLKYKENLEKTDNIEFFLDNYKFISNNFVSKLLESSIYYKLFKENAIDLIKSNTINEDFEELDILDHDIIFIDNKDEFVYLNRNIRKITNKSSLDKNSILKRNNYLRINIIDGKTFEVKSHELLSSKGILYNLKEGDYLDIIKFNRLILPTNFMYKSNRKFLSTAKLDIYIDKNIKNDIKIYYNNAFDKNKVKEFESKKYKELHYEEKNIREFKTKDFVPNTSKYVPSILLTSKINYKNELLKLQNNYMFQKNPFPYTLDLFNKYKKIETEKDLFNLVDTLLKKYSFSSDNMNNIAYNQRGDLFYFLHSLLENKGVLSEIILVHDTRKPDILPYLANHYDSKLLKVYLNSKEYYFDLSDNYSNKLDIKPYYEKKCLKIMNNGNIVKDILPNNKKLNVKNFLNIKMNDIGELIIDLKIYSSSKSRKELKKSSMEKIKNMFLSFIVPKIGEVKDISFDIKNLDNRLDNFVIEYSFKKKLSDFTKKQLYELISMWDLISYPLFYHYTLRKDRDIDLQLSHYYSKSEINLDLKKTYTLKGLKSINLKKDFGHYLRTIDKKSNNYTIKSEYYIKELILDKNKYKTIKEFSNNIQKTLLQEISIEK